jgi:quercetin dioxygenase-like cupin family protein
MAEPNLQSHDEAQEIAMFEGISRRTLNHGDKTSIHEIKIAKDAVVPEHTHPHEQTGYLVSGRLRFTMPGIDKVLAPGDSWLVPGDLPHEVTALEDSVALDIFAPARTEYIP